MANAYRDQNSVPTLIASSNADGFTPIRVYADPVTHRLLVDTGGGASGITSINADATAAQLLVVGTAGTDFAIVDNGTGTHTFNLPTASHTARGALSSADWDTFNGKQPAGNYITALTGDVSASGPGSVAATLTTVNSNVGSFTNASITVNGKGLITAAANGSSSSGTVTTVSVVTANGFAGTVATATTTPAITLTTSVTGILSGNGTTISAASTTGSGAVVLATSPTLVTPILGVAAATSINKVIITAPATSATLTIADGKTLTISDSTTLATAAITLGNAKVLTLSDSTTLNTNTITLGGGEVITFSASNALSLLTTGSTVMTFPQTTDTVVTLAATQTLTNKRVNARTNTTASSATPAINTDTTDEFTITALATNITSMTTSLSGTPVNGNKLIIRILDNGSPFTISWGASYASRGATLPTTTTASKYLYVGLIWNSTASTWDCVAVSQEA